MGKHEPQYRLLWGFPPILVSSVKQRLVGSSKENNNNRPEVGGCGVLEAACCLTQHAEADVHSGPG